MVQDLALVRVFAFLVVSLSCQRTGDEEAWAIVLLCVIASPFKG